MIRSKPRQSGSQGGVDGVEVIHMLGRLLVQFLTNALGLWFAALVIDGMHFNGDRAALAVTALAFSAVSILVKPFVVLLTLPVTILTLGFFLLVINALMLMLSSAVSPAYYVDDFRAALLGGVFMSSVGLAVSLVTGDLVIRSYRGSRRSPSGGRPEGRMKERA